MLVYYLVVHLSFLPSCVVWRWAAVNHGSSLSLYLPPGGRSNQPQSDSWTKHTAFYRTYRQGRKTEHATNSYQTHSISHFSHNWTILPFLLKEILATVLAGTFSPLIYHPFFFPLFLKTPLSHEHIWEATGCISIELFFQESLSVSSTFALIKYYDFRIYYVCKYIHTVFNFETGG